MDVTNTPEEVSEPLHLQKLQMITSKLQQACHQSDAVTWVPETIPTYVAQAVREALAAASENSGLATYSQQQQMLPSSPAAPTSQQYSLHAAAPSFPATKNMATEGFNFNDAAAGWGAAAGNGSHPAGFHHAGELAGTGSYAGTALHAAADVSGASTDPGIAAAAPAVADAGPPVLAGSQVLRSSTAKHGNISWVATSCLVPEGLPTAAAAEAGGGLACMEVVCRVLVLQDCCAAAASPGLVKALSKVKWQEFGLSFTDFTASSSIEDTTGILTLGVLPHAVVVPLTMVVCSTNSASSANSSSTVDSTLEEAHIAAAHDTTAPATAADANATGKRQRGSSSGPQAPPVLSCKRETLLFTGALEDALLALKARLPAGYFQGKLEACVTGCLPPITISLANILTRAANPHLNHQACQLLSCESQHLHSALLEKLQEAASSALAAKAAVGSSGLQKQLQQQYRGSTNRSVNRAKAVVEAAADVVAAASDGTGGAGSDADDDDVSAQQQQQQQQRNWHSQLLQGSTAGTEEGQRDVELQPLQVLQLQQQPATSLAQQRDQQQQQHESSVVLPPPTAAIWAGCAGSRKRGRQVAVLEELHGAEEQQHAVAAAQQGDVLCWVQQCEPHCQQQQQQQGAVTVWGDEDPPMSSSNLLEQAAIVQPRLKGTVELSSAGGPGVAARAADASDAAVAQLDNLMPGTGAAVPPQLREGGDTAGAFPLQLASGAGSGAAGFEAAGPKLSAAAMSGWRQRKHLPAGRRRVSGSAAANLF